MIDVCYSPDLLAALVDIPPSDWLNPVRYIRGRVPFTEKFVNNLKAAVRPSGVLVHEKPDGRAIVSCTVEYSINRHCVTTLFAAGDVRLVSIRAVGATNWSRAIDAVVGKYVDRVSVLSESSGVCVGFTMYRTIDKRDIETDTLHFSAGTVVDIDMGVSEYGFVGHAEEAYSAAGKITSLYGGTDDADPWLVIVEPDWKEL